MPQIDSLIRSLVWDRLTDGTIGLNAKIDSAMASSTLYADVDADIVKCGFELGTSALWGLIDPDVLESSTAIIYPFVCLDVTAATPGTGAARWVMSAVFAGTIQFAIQVHISWPESEVVPNFSAYGDLVQDAMHACLNDPDSQMTASGVAYNGRLFLQRDIVRMGGRNWRQTLTFQSTFSAVMC